MVRLWLLDQYDDAELDRKKVAAMFAGFVTRPGPDDVMGEDSAQKDQDGAALIGLQPGTMQLLLPGEDIKFSDPADVGGSYEAFLSAPTRIFFAEDLSVFWQGQNVSTRPRGVVAGISGFGFCEAWFAGAPSIVLGAPTATVNILHVRLELPFAVNPITGTPATVKPTSITLTAASLGASQMTIGNLCYIALSQGVYTLTTLLRGRRGTEVFTGAHAVGDLFVLLDDDGVARRPLGLDRLGDTFHYRAVGRGGELRDARTAQLTLAGNDLKPYAPAQLKATGSWGSNVTLSWQRCTRVGGELIDGTGEVPLAEDSEEYEVEILDGPSGAVLRTETGLSGPEFTYTTAMQSADFGMAQTELTFRVYQISAQVGRGFAGEGTVDV
jgi:hypothetical protein